MNFGISGTGGRSETSGRVEKAGRIEKGGSASQSQRMHGAGYVGAIVGQVGRVGGFSVFVVYHL